MLSSYRVIFLLYLLIFISYAYPNNNYNIIESTEEYIVFEVDFENYYFFADTVIDGKSYQIIKGNDNYWREAGEPWLPLSNLNIGIPFNSNPQIEILDHNKIKYSNKFIIPFPENDPQVESLDVNKRNQEIYSSNRLFPEEFIELGPTYIFRFSKVLPVLISPFQFNPVTREVVFNKKIKVRVNFNQFGNQDRIIVNDEMTRQFLQNSVVNPEIAVNWATKQINNDDSPSMENEHWYDPAKNYFKIYLKDKGVYKITFDYLIAAGVPISGGVAINNLAIYNYGQTIPIEVIDGGDQIFNSGDFIRFVGYPPEPTPYAKQNIHNIENVYWLTYEADSTNFYLSRNGYPSGTSNQIYNNFNTLHFEEEKSFHRLGYAPNGERDYWFWEQVEARNGVPTDIFQLNIGPLDAEANRTGEFPQGNLRVSLQGLTSASCNYGHSAFASLNGWKIASAKWNGQNDIILESDFLFGYYTNSPDSIRLIGDNNIFEVTCDGDVCTADGSDVILVNWFEFDYWRTNRVHGNNYIFKSPPDESGRLRFTLWRWTEDNMRIYIPERGELISNPWVLNDQYQQVLFEDTVGLDRTEYFCVSENYSLLPDSIVEDISSDLSNSTHGADYIIITHPKFNSYANQLAQFRSENLAGFSSPRVEVVNVFDIYDEYSYGLLDPFALQRFVKNAFEDWQEPAPAYVVLLGDMSWDYRHIFPGSYYNYVPSIPFHATTYGQAASDPLIGSVAGEDLIQDVIVGRISCNTLSEANVLIQKIFDYPADNGKNWKQDVLFLASGLDTLDELSHGFNYQSVVLEETYVLPSGIGTSKVFRYPNQPEYEPFQGEGPRIREEIDEGTVLANYYGHGGGGQWDFVFTNEDIYELENGGKLPFIISVTCYTAHFDNQDVFGEQFNKVPNKGSIGFFGSSGLTFWTVGVNLNKYIYREIFTDTSYVIGPAILNAKLALPPVGLTQTQMTLMTILGDPAIELALPKLPDFVLNSNSISVYPPDPVVGDTAEINIHIDNLGRSFPGDSIIVKLFSNSVSPGSIIDEKKIGSFGELHTEIFNWAPESSGLVNLIVQVNLEEQINEIDYSDNISETSVRIFDFGKPNIIKPVNGMFTRDENVEFRLMDIGYLVDRHFSYIIEIDTVLNLDSQAKIISPQLTPDDGIVKWWSPTLNQADYFWRVTIFDNADTNQSDIRIFTILDEDGNGFKISGRQLKLMKFEGVDYIDSIKSLAMNFDLLPPHPNNDTHLDSIHVNLYPNANGLTSFTTDGSYIYYGHLPYYTQGNHTAIYKIGTGSNGTIRGFNYGTIPNINLNLKNQIFAHSDGYLYAALGNSHNLLQINPQTGDTLTVYIPEGLLPSLDGLIGNDGYYLCSDGQNVYNLSAGYGIFRNKYILRVFDPDNNWQQVGSDKLLAGPSAPGFSGFIVVNNHLITYESYYQTTRQYNLIDGSFEIESYPAIPLIDLYTISYDWMNDFVYFSTFRPQNIPYTPAFHKYVGTYKNNAGFISSPEIGPATAWNDLEFFTDLTGSTAEFKANLLGKNRATENWDIISEDIPNSFDISDVNAARYGIIKLECFIEDSAGGQSQPAIFEGLKVIYSYAPEINLRQDKIVVSADSVEQGFQIDMKFYMENIGYTDEDSIKISYLLNGSDSAFSSFNTQLEADSVKEWSFEINTDTLLRQGPVTQNTIFVYAESANLEYFNFNNLIKKDFYVVRDSLKPAFTITFDGSEIINEDIVSANPDIMIALEDNSPLPLDTSYFTLIFDSEPLYFSRSDLVYEYTPYPNSRSEIHWTPELDDGRHVLEILAKDASGNFFDSTSYRTIFNVFNESDLTEVYNYPNPFTKETYFTFQLRGLQPPEEFNIKVYTVAGRLIRDIDVPISELKIGFNKFFWNGKDQDGDEVANGVYIYKVKAKFRDKIKSVTQKLARVR